jgi:hypothetical protein
LNLNGPLLQLAGERGRGRAGAGAANAASDESMAASAAMAAAVMNAFKAKGGLEGLSKLQGGSTQPAQPPVVDDAK